MKNLKVTHPEQISGQRAYGKLVAPAWLQRELEMVQRGCTGHLNPNPLGLKADLAEQQRERPRERRNQSAKCRSSSCLRDEAKREWQTLSSNDSEPAIDWSKNQIGPAKWEAALKFQRAQTKKTASQHTHPALVVTHGGNP